jgi:hypothetical protein
MTGRHSRVRPQVLVCPLRRGVPSSSGVASDDSREFATPIRAWGRDCRHKPARTLTPMTRALSREHQSPRVTRFLAGRAPVPGTLSILIRHARVRSRAAAFHYPMREPIGSYRAARAPRLGRYATAPSANRFRILRPLAHARGW